MEPETEWSVRMESVDSSLSMWRCCKQKGSLQLASPQLRLSPVDVGGGGVGVSPGVRPSSPSGGTLGLLPRWLLLEDEDESSLPFINLPPPAPAPSQRSGLSSRSNHRGSKPRVPPEGLEGLTPGDTPTPPPPTSTGDSLSCGDASCKDPFCLQQRHMLREESTDSILTDHSVSGSM